MDDVLDNNSKSTNQLSNALAEEKGRFDKLVIKIGDETEGVIKEINDINSSLELPPIDFPELL